MKIKELVSQWQSSAGEQRAPNAYEVRLPLYDAAKIEALTQMFPGLSAERVITDLLASALDEFVRDSMRGSRSGGKRGINAAKLPAASLGPPKCLASLSDSDFWKKGLGVDGQLLARLRDLEIKEVSGESGPGGEEWGRGDGEDWI